MIKAWMKYLNVLENHYLVTVKRYNKLAKSGYAKI